jgi:CheY-like chemotaxis protein/HPt (histidine-containing phosphotransfer) domain-containing protein
MVPLALQRGVDLFCYVAPELPHRVMGDDVRLRQILANLVGNAVKFSGGRPGRRGRVEVRVTPAGGGELRIEVADNGIGISPEAQARLFQPFSQSEESTTRRFGGSGLGLIICQRLAELMRGDIGMQSTPGEGSMFWVRLPLTAAPGPATAPLPDLGGVRVHLQEDELLPADCFARYLAEAGAVVTRSSGAQVPADGVDVLVAAAAREGPAAVPAGSGQVLLYRDVRRAPSQLGARVVKLSAAATRRRALLQAVAAAAGRAPAALPETDSAPHPARLAAPDIATAAARGELILVAEDDAINRKVILRQLQLLGRAAEVAADGAAALSTWRRGRTALVLTDLHMPEMDGYALARAIRSEEREEREQREKRAEGEEGDAAGTARPKTPIVALTANALRGESERVAELGFDDYITKPATLDRLRAVLDRWLPGQGGAGENGADDTALQAEETVLDVGVLEKLIGAQGELVDEFLDAFLDSATGLASDIDRACLTRDPGRLAAVAHKLKSSARSVGALALGELCARIERQARSGKVDFAAEPNLQVRARLEGVREAAAQRRGRKAGQ